MGKRKFSVGEFVCAVNYEEQCFYYVYNYRSDAKYPYCLFSLSGRLYKAQAKHLKPMSKLNVLLNKVLPSLSSSKISFSTRAAALQKEDIGYRGPPLDWGLDLRVRHD